MLFWLNLCRGSVNEKERCLGISLSADQKRERFLPKISQCFAENGFRGTTTAKLAQVCEVRENVLYRIWPSKKEMFLDCIEHIYELTMELWEELPEPTDGRTRAEMILLYQAEDHGLLRYYRLVFAGLLEDDPDIRKALRKLYRQFQAFITQTTEEHRQQKDVSETLNSDTSAWALMGLAAMVDIQRELRILTSAEREKFMIEAGTEILESGKR